MSNPYVGEIRIFAGTFAPANWLFCDGQSLPVSQNPQLFQTIGTTYGGDGVNNFNVPDLRGRLPVHNGTGADGIDYQRGQAGGLEQVTLVAAEMATHTHAMACNEGASTTSDPNGALLAILVASQPTVVLPYANYDPTRQVPLNPAGVTSQGGGQPHENRQPSLGLNFIIALTGQPPA